jgi:hypothetical protein
MKIVIFRLTLLILVLNYNTVYGQKTNSTYLENDMKQKIELDLQKIKRHTFLNTYFEDLKIKDEIITQFKEYINSELFFEYHKGFYFRVPCMFYSDFFIDIGLDDIYKNYGYNISIKILEGYFYKNTDTWDNGIVKTDFIDIDSTLEFLNLLRIKTLENKFYDDKYIWITEDLIYGNYNGIDCYYNTHHMNFKDDEYDFEKIDFLKITSKDTGEIITWLKIKEGENEINDQKMKCNFKKVFYKENLIKQIDRAILYCEICRKLNLTVSKSYE